MCYGASYFNIVFVNFINLLMKNLKSALKKIQAKTNKQIILHFL